MTDNRNALIERLRKRASQAGMLLVDPPRPSADMLLFNEAADALLALTPAGTGGETLIKVGDLIPNTPVSWTATPPREPVAASDWFAGDVDCDGNELITVRKDEWDRLKAAALVCRIPPDGWACSRKAGHDGPCAATPAPPTAAGESCSLGVGCDETGICYADAHDQSEQCGRVAAPETKGEVTQADRDLRQDMLRFIADALDKPCAERDTPDDLNDELDRMIARHRTTAISTLQAEVERKDALYDGEARKTANLIRQLALLHVSATAAEAQVRELREVLEKARTALEEAGYDHLVEMLAALSPKEPSDG